LALEENPTNYVVETLPYVLIFIIYIYLCFCYVGIYGTCVKKPTTDFMQIHCVIIVK